MCDAKIGEARCQLAVEVVGGVGERREDQHLAVARIDRRRELVPDAGGERLELEVVLGRDRTDTVEEPCDHGGIVVEVAPERLDVHVREVDLNLGADCAACR